MTELLNEFGNPDMNSKWYKACREIEDKTWEVAKPILDNANLSLPELRMVLMNFPGWISGSFAAYLIHQQTLKRKEDK